MSAALRVAWIFFTALPLQRWLGSAGIALGGLLAIAGVLLREPPFWTFGLLVLLILAVFPALFASAAVFRALSAPRANQLLPRFRGRMLGAVALFIAGIVASFALLLFVMSSFEDRAMPVEPLSYAFVFATAVFMLMFLQFGDWRWLWLWVGSAVTFSVLGVYAAPALAAIPPWAWIAAACAIWIAFGAWYVQASRIKPLALVPQPHAGAWSRAELGESVTREAALRALVTARPPNAKKRVLWIAIGIALGAGLIAAAALTPTARLLPFTSFVWPFGAMMMCWSKATGVTHRSRLLWLRIPGPREGVRREVERALLRNFGSAMVVVLGAAALYGSPLFALPPREVLAGIALAACAGLFGTYAALAAIPGNLVHIAAFALLMLAQIGLLARPSPALADVVIVTAIELVGALAFRAFAHARWRRIDWTRLRPLPQASMFRDA